MKLLSALLALLALSGCVAPAPHPFVSPLSLTFTSPLPAAHLVYLPLYTHTISKHGISLACGYEDMARLDRETQALGVSWTPLYAANGLLTAAGQAYARPQEE